MDPNNTNNNNNAVAKRNRDDGDAPAAEPRAFKKAKRRGVFLVTKDPAKAMPAQEGEAFVTNANPNTQAVMRTSARERFAAAAQPFLDQPGQERVVAELTPRDATGGGMALRTESSGFGFAPTGSLGASTMAKYGSMPGEVNNSRDVLRASANDRFAAAAQSFLDEPRQEKISPKRKKTKRGIVLLDEDHTQAMLDQERDAFMQSVNPNNIGLMHGMASGSTRVAAAQPFRGVPGQEKGFVSQQLMSSTNGASMDLYRGDTGQKNAAENPGDDEGEQEGTMILNQQPERELGPRLLAPEKDQEFRRKIKYLLDLTLARGCSRYEAQGQLCTALLDFHRNRRSLNQWSLGSLDLAVTKALSELRSTWAILKDGNQKNLHDISVAAAKLRGFADLIAQAGGGPAMVLEEDFGNDQERLLRGIAGDLRMLKDTLEAAESLHSDLQELWDGAGFLG